jgi:Flp pilus assembly protein TadG
MNFRERFTRFTRRHESGQSIVLLAIGFIALIAFVGITTDVSLMFVRYSQLSRAVDAAAIAAANQMRQDRSQANLGISARQFVELYGVSPELVLADTCQSKPGDPLLCRTDQAKLVRVTAQIQSPTVFLRLLGFQAFTLQASAISETAALDVVIIMDVSESMAGLTTPEDWAKIGLGVIYRPPRFNAEVYAKLYPTASTTGVTVIDAWKGNDTRGIPPQNSLINTWQQNVNNRLFYADGSGNVAGLADNKYEVIYDKTYFNGKVTDANGVLVTTQNHPRVECRVRFASTANDTNTSSWLGFYDTVNKTYAPLIGSNTTNYPNSLFGKLGNSFKWAEGTGVSRFFDGFVPTYNYYGCCNDPSGDNDFSDLICQPFKQARDAVLQFMDRLDFTRGDRMAVVTFDRTAFLVNPFGYEINTTNPKCANLALSMQNAECRPQAMMDNGTEAREAVENLLGVRAEPNFYVYNPGSWTADASNALVRVKGKWTGYAAGIGSDGRSIPVDFAKGTPSFDLRQPTTVPKPIDPALYNYPVKDNCPFKVAALDDTRSMYGYALQNISHPNVLDSTGWKNYGDGDYKLYNAFDGSGNPDVTSYNILMSYEIWASCRGSNIGAGLRIGNNALLNPLTIRQSGTIWVMIMLANGGAGASDPVRRNRQDLTAGNPYAYDTTKSKFGVVGAYGALGLCPYGIPSTNTELMKPNNDRASFPYCSDESPRSRHSCNFRPKYSLDSSGDPLPSAFKIPSTGQICTVEGPNCRKLPAIADAGYIFYHPSLPYGSNGPSSAGSEELWNSDNNNLYDVDLANCNEAEYDVDDYARDWADYVALRNEEDAAGTNLPTIFTIGFGTEYAKRTTGTGASTRTLNAFIPGDTQQLCALNVGDCLGEQVLRYIADVGDNNTIDNDYYEYVTNIGSPPGSLDTSYNGGSYGPRDPCQSPNYAPIKIPSTTRETYDKDNDNILDLGEEDEMYGHYLIQQNCGNYYYAPDYSQLQFVFDDIASRMFTRLSR